jgi:hypothetical protein
MRGGGWKRRSKNPREYPLGFPRDGYFENGSGRKESPAFCAGSRREFVNPVDAIGKSKKQGDIRK